MRPRLLSAPSDALPSNRPAGAAAAAALHAAGVTLLLLVTAGPRLAPAAGTARSRTGWSWSWCRRQPLCRRRCSSSADPGSRRWRQCRRPAAFTTADGFSYDTSRIRLRGEVLFPFLTGRLPFLDELRAAAAADRQRLHNPLGTGRRRRAAGGRYWRSAPPRATRSWTGRGRAATAGRACSTIAELTGRYDPDDGQLPAVVRGHVERNLLQPYLESSVPDPRFWVMLGLAADHLDVIQFVGRHAQQHPSSRTTTELLFLLDELAEANRGAFALLMHTNIADLESDGRIEPGGRAVRLAAAARLRKLDARTRPRPGEGARRALRRRAPARFSRLSSKPARTATARPMRGSWPGGCSGTARTSPAPWNCGAASGPTSARPMPRCGARFAAPSVPTAAWTC